MLILTQFFSLFFSFSVFLCPMIEYGFPCFFHIVTSVFESRMKYSRLNFRIKLVSFFLFFFFNLTGRRSYSETLYNLFLIVILFKYSFCNTRWLWKFTPIYFLFPYIYFSFQNNVEKILRFLWVCQNLGQFRNEFHIALNYRFIFSNLKIHLAHINVIKYCDPLQTPLSKFGVFLP